MILDLGIRNKKTNSLIRIEEFMKIPQTDFGVS